MDSNYQDQVLRELGISDTTQAQKISNDGLVLKLAMDRAIKAQIPGVLADMDETQRNRLLKRTGPPAQAVITVQFSVGRTNISGEHFIMARGTKSLGRDNVILGDQFYTGAPDKAAGFKAFGQQVPADVAAEYARNYQHVYSESNQAHIYQTLCAPTPKPDLTRVPGPGFQGTSK